MPPRTLQTDPAKLLPSILRFISSSPPDAYSAHQKARTTAARLVHAEKYTEAIEILWTTAKELLKLGEAGSGCDLGVYMVQVYIQADVEVTSESRARITQLLALLTPQGSWRKKLADLAIKWSSEHGDCLLGDPDLHQYIGQLYYKDHQYPQAEVHLVAACKRDSAIVLADMMYDWSRAGREDPGTYACRVVIPWLSIKPPAILPAREFLNAYIQRISSSDPSFVNTTMDELAITTCTSLNFLQLAVETVQRAPPEGMSAVEARGTTRGIPREWETLVRRYKGSESVMSSQAMQEALMHISTNTFLIPPPRRAGGNADMIQNLMGSLFGGGAR